MILGHTRLGTMGANENRNAHPFKEGNVIGTHNGMVYNYSELDHALSEFHKPLRVDSQVIFRILSEVTPEGKTYAEALPLIRGSLALAWHDVRDSDGLWLFKHSNPLSMAFAPTAKTAFWSSEYEHLAIMMQSVYGNNWETVSIKSDILYRMEWNGKDLMWTQWDVDMLPYSPKPKGVQPPLQLPTKQEPMTLNAVNGTPIDSGPVEKEKNWDKQVEYCGLCGNRIDWDDNNAFYDIDSDDVFCGACAQWWDNNGQDLYDNIGEAKVSGHFGRETFFSREPAEHSLSEIGYLR